MSLVLIPKPSFDQGMSAFLGAVPKRSHPRVLHDIYNLAEHAQAIEAHRIAEGDRTNSLRRERKLYKRLDLHCLHFLSNLKKFKLSLGKSSTSTLHAVITHLSELESAVVDTRMYIRRVTELEIMQVHPDLRNSIEAAFLRRKRVIVLRDLPHLRNRVAEHWFILSLESYLAPYIPTPTLRLTVISRAMEHAFGFSDWNTDRIRHAIGSTFKTRKCQGTKERAS